LLNKGSFAEILYRVKVKYCCFFLKDTIVMHLKSLKSLKRLSTQKFLIAFMLSAVLASILAFGWIYPPYTISKYIQQIGVKGTTLNLPKGTWVEYMFWANGGEKVSFTVSNFIGTINVCIYDGSNWQYCDQSFSSPVTKEWTYSTSGVYRVAIRAVDTDTTAILRWDKYTCGWLWCSSTNEGKSQNNPMPIIGYRGGIEATLDNYQENHWYRYPADPLPSYYGSGYYSFVVSIVGSSGTSYGLAVYDSSGNEINGVCSVAYPLYLYVKATSSSSYLVRVSPAVLSSSINEYHLQVHRPMISNYTLSTTSVKPGDEFTINYNIWNPFPHSITVWLGASIEDSTGKLLDSPQYDVSVSLSPGYNWYSRKFKVPSDALLGKYNLRIAIWGKKNSDGTMDILFDYRKYDGVLTVSVPSNPQITYAAASPSTVAPTDSTTVTVKWIFYRACTGGCYVVANAYGDWAPTQELARIYQGVDGNYGVEQSKSFTVTIPSSVSLGTHYIRVGFCYAYSPAPSYNDLGQCTHVDIPVTVQKVATAITVSPSSFTVNSGGSVQFSAQLLDSSGKPLANKPVTWSSNIGNCNPSSTTTDAGGYAYTMCYAPSVSSDTTMSVTAAFGGDAKYQQSSRTVSGTVKAATYQVTVDPNGGRVYVDGSAIVSRTTYSWTYGSTHTLDPDSGYSPSAGVRLIFTSWSDGNTLDPRTITVTGAVTYVAQWRKQYQLTISVSSQAAGTTSPAPGQYWYDEGGAVTVTATASSGYVFDHWELDGASAGTSPTITVSMNGPHTLKAVFSSAPQQSFYVVVRGTNNLIYYALCTLTGCGAWSQVPQGSTPDSPAAVLVGSTLYLAVRGSYDTIWFSSLDLSTGSFSGWSQIPGSTPSRPALTAYGTKLFLVVRGSNNVIYLKTYDTSTKTWTDWASLPGSTPDAPAAVAVNGQLHVAVRDSSGAIWHGRRDLSTGNWLGWVKLDGMTFQPPALTTDGTNVWLAVLGTNQLIYLRQWSGSWSNSWISPPSGSSSATPAVKIVSGYLTVTVKSSTSSAIYYCYRDLASGNWGSWQPINGYTPSAPVAP